MNGRKVIKGNDFKESNNLGSVKGYFFWLKFIKNE